MTLGEALETTKIHSVVGKVKDSGLMSARPFRSPHHTIYSVLPICKLQFQAQKPQRLPLPNPNDTSLGAELKRRRLALEWSQSDTAKYFGVLKDSYQKWEWNKITPNIKNRKHVNAFLKFNYWDDGSDTLSNKLMQFKIKNKLTNEEIAELLGLSSETIRRTLIGNNVSKKAEIKISKLIKP